MNLAEAKDFGLKDEQRALRAAVREMVAERIAPKVAAYEKAGQFPTEFVDAMREMGLLGILMPEEFGGAGADYISYGIVCEELAYGDWVSASVVSVQNSLVGSALLEFGLPEQKRRWLAPMAQGRALSAACLTEPSGGSDLSSLQTRAKRDGSNYILNGSKVFISHATHADYFLVLASVNLELKQKGITAFVVEKNTPGLSARTIPLHTLRRGDVCEVFFEDVVIPAENRLGEEGEGMRIIGNSLDTGRFSVASRAVGQAQAALDAALEYAKQRQMFGQHLGRFQMVQGMLAEMIAAVDSARMMVYRVGHLKDAGVGRVSLQASLGKLVATQTCMKVTHDAAQIFGGYGLAEEYPVGRWFQEAKVLEVGEGANELHRQLIADYALGYRRM